ncbi:MAG: exodeoxyribonuclease VII large subunit [Pseudomonadota bacterium]|nr:exodeoxyribonuclease VII large subunit [Pseudomonadota bacterium]MDE3037346.1 exodeoxyribonuclease VII large subunit [Pseudomonadota bacterium]
MPEPAPDFNHNQPVYSVSEVSQAIRRAVEDTFGVIRIRGEISGFKQAASGHVYFRLKDENAVIDAVCWRGVAARFSFKPGDGLEIVAAGKVTTYPGRSSYQIVIDHMEPAGAGALMALLEKRRKALAAEGLFAPERKRRVPFLPAVIGVITSPTGAVIRDILHRIEDRFPLHVIIWPVMVQGEGAAEQVAAAIEGFNSLPSGFRIPVPDVLIVARGGGSIEDLWAFNEEIVVRAAAASEIPLISAVGHETDTTLIDYASDQRAPTPTAAAEMAVPVRQELWLGIKQLDARLMAAMQRQWAWRQESLTGLSRGLLSPVQLLQSASQRLDDWGERLLSAPPSNLARKEQQLALLTTHLKPQALLAFISVREEKLRGLGALLASVDCRRVLERGFALVKDAGGKLVTSAAQAKENKTLSVVFKDGEMTVKNPA